MSKQRKRKPPGNPPTMAEMFPIDLNNPNILTNHNQRARNLRSNYRLNADGSHSTVLMGQQDNFAYPTLFPRNNYSTNPSAWAQINNHDSARVEAARRGEVFEFGSEAEARKFAEGAWKNRPTKKRIALKQYGGSLGILSPMPSLQMPQRGMNPASPAFPSTGFSVMNVSGNHLKDKRAVGSHLPNLQGGGFTNFLNANASGIGGVAGLGSGLLASLSTPEGKPGTGKAAAAGALGGIAAGAAFGPIGMAAGAVIGGLTGFFKKRKENKAAEEQELLIAQQTKNTMKQLRFNRDASSIGLFPTDGVEGVNNYYTALGGFPSAEYVAEGDEVVVFANGGAPAGGEPTAFNGVLDQVSSNMAVIDGASHAEGGVDMAGGEFIFSKKMKSSKELSIDLQDIIGYTPKDRSYAGIAESIGKKKGDLEEKLESHDPFALKTAEVMMERYDEALELVASEQEFRKTKVA